MIDKQNIIDLTEQYLLLSETESYLVAVDIEKDNRIVVTIDNDGGVDIDECVNISNYLEDHLDRDAEDFELEVGSAGLSMPLRILRQYQKYEGKRMEVLCKDGKKLVGTLGKADAEGFDLTVTRKVKPEGAKKKIDVTETMHLPFDLVNSVKYSFD